MNLIDKLTSILTGTTTTLTRLLSEPMTQPFRPQFIESFREQNIVSIPIVSLNGVNGMDLSIPYNSMKSVTNSVVNDADKASNDITQLSRLVDGATTTIARRVDRTQFLLDNIKATIASDHENPSVIFTETFDNMNMTDANETTATVRSGSLHSNVSSDNNTFVATPTVYLINTASYRVSRSGSSIFVSAVAAGLASTPIDGVGGCGAVMLTAHRLSSPQKVTTVSVNASNKTRLAKAYGIDGAGKEFELDNPEIVTSVSGNTYIFSFDSRVISGVACVSYSQEARVIDRSTVKAILTNSTGVSEPDGIVEQIRSAAAAFSDPTDTTGYHGAYVYSIDLKVEASHNDLLDVTERTSYWKSKPITIEGDVKTIKLNAMQSLPAGTDVCWQISINGSSFMNIVPTNVDEIQSERIKFNPDGTALFRFPVKDKTSYAIVEGLGEGSTTADYCSGNKTIGTDVTGPHEEIGAVSYKPEISSEIDLNAFGIAPDAPSVIEARTNGTLGEKFSSSSDRKIVLSHRPSAALTIYVGGAKASEVTDMSVDDPSLDPNRYFFQRFGKEVKFNRDVFNITAYYSYPVSTVTVAATLTATPSAKRGPSVQFYSLALTNI